MVYVVIVDQQVAAARPYVTKTVPISMRPTQAVDLALVVHDMADSDGHRMLLSQLGLVIRGAGQKASTYDHRLKIEQLFPVFPQPIDSREVVALPTPGDIAEILANRNNDVLILQPEDTTSLLQEIVRLRPDMDPVIQWLLAMKDWEDLGNSERERLWREQRDAANLALRLGGFSATPLRAWRRPPDDQPFLFGVVPYPHFPGSAMADAADNESPVGGISELYEPFLADLVSPTEPRLIDHDARAFPGWQREPTRSMHVHTFTDGTRRMEIINVDASGVERHTGADLIYYHVASQSFVLVQYKRLERRSYSVNERFIGQLSRMEELATFNRDPRHPGDWRIGADFTYFKLADIEQRNAAPDRLVNGLYLSTSYLRILLANGQRTLGYETVERYLSNQQFIDLVAHGLIGTVGVTKDQLRNIVRGLADAGDGVVIAKDLSAETPKDRQRRLRSRSWTPA